MVLSYPVKRLVVRIRRSEAVYAAVDDGEAAAWMAEAAVDGEGDVSATATLFLFRGRSTH